MRLSGLIIGIAVAALVVCSATKSLASAGPVRPGWSPTTTIAPPNPQLLTARVPRIWMQDLGRHSPGTTVNLAVVLNYRHASELQQFVAMQGNAQTRGARGVLSAEQFQNYFSPSVHDYEQTLAALVRAGFTVTQTYPNRTVIDVTAPAAVAERTFATEIHSVRQADGSLHYANVRPAYIPSQLKNAVFAVAGFDNLTALKTTNVRYTGARPAVVIGPPLQAPDLGLGPFAFATAYDLPVQHAIAGGKTGQTYDGAGQPAAIVIDADFLDSDLVAFLNYFHVKRSAPVHRLKINGGPPAGLILDSQETTLDVETIASLAPGAPLYVYEMDSLKFTSTIDAYNKIVSDNLVGAVNSSFGACEDQTDPANFPTIANHIALQGSALGIVFAASSGDSGSNECGFSFFAPQGVSAPASGPYFVAVGGTALFLHTSGKYSVEIGWPGSGGGVSDIFGMPPYQMGVHNMIGTTRNVPDIAFDASPASGAAFYINGGWYGPIGGTSLAAPIFTALATELAQYDHARLGNIHPALYHAFNTYHYTLPAGAPLFHDARANNNGWYNAVSGYDQLTGIGSIDGWNFAVTTHL